MSNKKPNLIVVFPDQFRKQAIGYFNEDPVVTPNLDKFAEESRVLKNAVSNQPVCSPFRAMLLTGKYPHTNGVIGNCNSKNKAHGVYLKENEPCFSDILSEAGYNQAYIGKWHLDPPVEKNAKYTGSGKTEGILWDTYTPPERRHGFDFWYSYGCWNRHLQPHYWNSDAAVDERVEINDWSVKHETDVAIDYIQNKDNYYRDSEAPFSLFLAFNPPHPPFEEVPARYLKQYEDKAHHKLLNRDNAMLVGRGREAKEHVRNYFAAITGIDQQFGRILQTLEEKDLKNDTIVIFTSDHGEMMGSHGMRRKIVWYDESLLIPFIIRWPGKIAPGEDDLLLSVPDIMPTLLGLLALSAEIPASVQGRNFSSLFRGEGGKRPRSALYLNVPPSDPAGGLRGLRTHSHTFVMNSKTYTGPAVLHGTNGEITDVKDDFITTEIGPTILYDNINDPYQMTNIAEDNPEKINELKKILQRWLVKTGDPWRW